MPVSAERTEATSYWWTEGEFGGVIGRRGFHALVSYCGVENDPGASEVWFSSARRKRLVTALRGIAPIGAVPVGASFLVVVGTTKGLVLIGPKP